MDFWIEIIFNVFEGVGYKSLVVKELVYFGMQRYYWKFCFKVDLNCF